MWIDRVRHRGGGLRTILSAFAVALLGSACVTSTVRAHAPKSGSERAQSAEAESTTVSTLRLEELLEHVRTQNPSARAARDDAAALGFVREQVSALPDPMLMATYQPLPLMTARGWQRSQWRVEQTIPFPGKLGLQGDIADLGATIAEFEAQTLEQDLVVRAKQSFYELARIQQQIALTREFQQRLADFEQIAATQYEVGTGAQQSILKAQVEKNSLAQRLIELEERRRSTLESLAWLTNEPLRDPLRVEVEPAELDLPPEEVLVQLAGALRPEVAALQTAERRAEKQIELGRKQYLPDFGLNATYFDLAASDLMASATGRDALALGVSVKLPVQRDRIRAQIGEAQARARSVASRQEALESSYTTQIADLSFQIRQESDQVTLYQELLLPQALTNVEATLSAYTTGRTDFLNLLDAERMLFQLRVGYEDALARYLKATAALERALGVDSLAQLQNVDALLRDRTEND